MHIKENYLRANEKTFPETGISPMKNAVSCKKFYKSTSVEKNPLTSGMPSNLLLLKKKSGFFCSSNPHLLTSYST